LNIFEIKDERSKYLKAKKYTLNKVNN